MQLQGLYLAKTEISQRSTHEKKKYREVHLTKMAQGAGLWRALCLLLQAMRTWRLCSSGLGRR